MKLLVASWEAGSVETVNKDVMTTAPVVTDDDILAQFKQQENSDEEDGCEEVNGIAPQRPSRSEVENALETLTNAALYSNTGDDMQTLILKFVGLSTKERSICLKQVDITNYFQKFY